MQIRGTLMLLGASFFWGTTFVAQMSGMDELGPFSYAAARYFIGFLSMLAVMYFTHEERFKAEFYAEFFYFWEVPFNKSPCNTQLRAKRRSSRVCT